MLHARLHLGNLERLADVVARALRDCLLGDLLVALAGHEDHLATVERGLHLPEDLEAVRLAHLDVADDELGRDVLQLFERFLAVGEGERLVPHFLAGCDDEFDDVGFIVHDEDLGHGVW